MELKKWRKLGAGSMHLSGRMIKPNEVFMAYDHEISPAFRDLVELIEGRVEPQATPEPQKVLHHTKQVQPKRGLKPQFGIEKSHVAGFYNVINLKTKKKLNDMPMLEEDAKNKVKELTE